MAQDRWDALLPALLKKADEAIKPAQEADVPNLDAAAHRSSAANYLVSRLVSKMNLKLWAGPEADLQKTFAELLTADEVAGALDYSLSRLEMINVQLRTLSARIFTEGQQFKGAWSLESGPGTMKPIGGVPRVSYDFRQDRSPIVLKYELDLPAGVKAEELHKLTVSIKADDSWHGITGTVDWGEYRWESQRTLFVAQHRQMSIIFQPPTFDDETNRARIWVPIRPAGPRQDGKTADKATIRLLIHPSGTALANLGKMRYNYERAFLSVPFWKYVINSLLLVGLTMGGALFSSAFVAYAFARLNWPGRSFAFVLLLSTMMLPSQVTMIPSFMIWKTLGWYNTLNPMWVPAWFGTAFFIFLMVQHMRTIPRELEEAARLDGLNALQTWYYIILPQVKPTLAAIAIMTFMGAWNEFMGPLIYLRDQDKFPLSLGLFGMRIDQTADWTMIMAGNMLMTLPVIIIFFLFQRYFIQGMTMSGMKA